MVPQFIEVTVASSGKARAVNLMQVVDIAENRTGHAIIALVVEQENYVEGSREGVLGQRVYVCEETYAEVMLALSYLNMHPAGDPLHFNPVNVRLAANALRPKQEA